MDITSNDAVYHTAPVRSLFNIINAGKILSYSRRRELEKIYEKNQEHKIEINGHYELAAQEGKGNFDLISCTKINKKDESNYIEELGEIDTGPMSVGSNFVSFVFSYVHSKNKFTNITIGKQYGRLDRRRRPSRRNKKISQGPVAGMWPGEIMAKGSLSLEECYGLVFGEKFSSLKIEEFEMLTLRKDKTKQEEIFKREYERKLEKRKLLQEGIEFLQKYIGEILSILKNAEYTNISISGDGEDFGNNIVNIQNPNANNISGKFCDGVVTDIQSINESVDASFKKLFTEIENKKDLLYNLGNADHIFNFVWHQILDLEKDQQDSPDFSEWIASFFISFIGRLWRDSIKLKILSQEENSEKYTFDGSTDEWIGFANKTLEEKLDSQLKATSLEPFQYTPSLECQEILNMLDAIKEVRGNITIDELMAQIGQKLQIPIYSVDEKATNFSLRFPKK
ncbi:MAG: hypothetical protein V1688_00980 [bacterium]